MRLATLSDRAHCIALISEAYKGNPSYGFVVRGRFDDSVIMHRVSAYLFDSYFAKQGVWLSDDGNALAVCFKSDAKIPFWKVAFLQVKLTFGALGLIHVWSVLKRENFTKSVREKQAAGRKFRYFGLFAANEIGKKSRGAWELKNELFDLIDREQCLLLSETTLEKNAVVYERFGMKVYATIETPENGLTTYFLEREPQSKG